MYDPLGLNVRIEYVYKRVTPSEFYKDTADANKMPNPKEFYYKCWHHMLLVISALYK
jgi:hypothetical protein